jgi:hypothetical protein
MGITPTASMPRVPEVELRVKTVLGQKRPKTMNDVAIFEVRCGTVGEDKDIIKPPKQLSMVKGVLPCSTYVADIFGARVGNEIQILGRVSAKMRIE